MQQPTIITLKKVNRDFNITTKMGPRPFTIPGARDGDLNTTGNVSFPSSLDGPTVYKYFNNMTINEGHTVTTSNRCKGLVITCLGDCTINGSLSMTARGCRGEGENFAPHGINNVIRASDHQVMNLTIGANGGAGGHRATNRNGYNGSVGTNGACGGGGSGKGGASSQVMTSGSGSSATTWSGGSGGGGAYKSNSHCGHLYAENAGSNGGKGGNAITRHGTGWGGSVVAGGGAGNIYGNGARSTGSGWCVHHWFSSSNGQIGTGGLIILIVQGKLIINGNIQSRGSNGGSGRSGGGSSGGGSITVLYKDDYINNGSILANGGASISDGGAGGAGSIRVHKIV